MPSPPPLQGHTGTTEGKGPGMSHPTLSFRSGPITLLIDLTGQITQNQWDAIGGLLARVEELQKKLEGKSDA